MDRQTKMKIVIFGVAACIGLAIGMAVFSFANKDKEEAAPEKETAMNYTMEIDYEV